MLKASKTGAARRLAFAACLLLVACPGQVPGPNHPDENALRFVIQTRAAVEPGGLRSRLEEYFGTSVSVEPLFPGIDPDDDPEGMARMFRISAAPDSARSVPVWSRAYDLESALGLEHAEPDFENTLARGIESGGACKVSTPPPPDRRWSLEEIGAIEAWDLEPPATGRRFGEGISICHPDTGWAEHEELDDDRIDTTRALNLLEKGSADARDPLDYSGLLLNPGHGTATGSVLVSRADRGELAGVAPMATLVPIRTAKSVIQVFDSDLARAVHHAVEVEPRCHVISMSLGGRTFFGLRAAIRRAVRHNLIVLAAAGNCVGFVVAPAAYDACMAVAATNDRHQPWIGSSHGFAVDVAAPGEQVWAARRKRADDPTRDDLYAGQGTSFAVANVAGAAALWLAFHGPETLEARYPGVPLQEVFRTLLRRTAKVPEQWMADQYGAGILDVRALLSAELPDPAEIRWTAEEAGEDPLNQLAAVLGLPPGELASRLEAAIDTSEMSLTDQVRRYEPELVQLALENPREFARVFPPPAPTAGSEERGVPEGALRLEQVVTDLRQRLRQ